MSKKKKSKPSSGSQSSSHKTQEKFGISLSGQLSRVKGRKEESLPAVPVSSPPRNATTSSQSAEEDVDWYELWTPPSEDAEKEWLQWAGTEVEKMPESSPAPAKHSSKTTPAASSPSARPSSSAKASQTTATSQTDLRKKMADLETTITELQQQQQIWLQHQETLEQECRRLQEEQSAWTTQRVHLQQEHTHALEAARQLEEQYLQEKKRGDHWFQEYKEMQRDWQEQQDLAMLPVSSLLQQRGVPNDLAQEAWKVMATRLSVSLLPQLYSSGENFVAWLRRHLALCCEHPDCEEVYQSAPSTVAVVRVSDPHLCENCQGSDNRRAIRRMIRICQKHRKSKIVVVGGSPDSHAELQRLVPSGLELKLIDGSERRHKQQATDDLRYSDLVVIWGPTILSHKVSDLYTEQKDAFPNRIVMIHKRGVASFARHLCAILEGVSVDQTADDQD